MVTPATPLSEPVHGLERLPEEWSAKLVEWGQPRYRGMQIFQWIHKQGVFDPAKMTNLPKRLREKLEEEGFELPHGIQQLNRADDGTRKLLLGMHKGGDVETVLIPMPKDVKDAPQDNSHTYLPITQCISSQVGCAMACVFCASGRAGLKRQLTAGEIIGQVLQGRALMEEGQRLRNVVFMGMGEPLHNYPAVARALTLMFHGDGLDLSKRRVTVSTSGLIPEIDKLGRDFNGEVQLAVSLHVPDNDRRSDLMPINRKYPLKELLACLRRYPLPKRRRITIEYTLIAGFNDSLKDADLLAKVLRGIPAKVNLIPMNPVPDAPWKAPTWEQVESFQMRLRDNYLPTFVRRRKGDKIAAACGQLALPGEKRKVRVKLPTIPTTA